MFSPTFLHIAAHMTMKKTRYSSLLQHRKSQEIIIIKSMMRAFSAVVNETLLFVAKRLIIELFERSDLVPQCYSFSLCVEVTYER